MVAVRGLAGGFVGEVGVDLDLVHHQCDTGLGDDPVEVVGLKFGDTRQCGLARLLELHHRLAGGHEVAVVQAQERPVDEEEVDPVQAEALQ